MSIRWKLLTLMLVIAVVPVAVTSWLNVRGLSNLGAQLAQQSGQALSDHARSSLWRLADEYARILEREGQLVELLLHLQKREVERLLANPPVAPAPVYFEDAFEARATALDLETVPMKYFRIASDGQRFPVPVSLRSQVMHVAPGVTATAVEQDALKLAPLSEFYAQAHRHHDDTVYWQYTALENGLTSSFPGHGNYPADFDSRSRPWYVRQKALRAFDWSPPHIDVSSRLTLISASMPVYRPAGEFAGVTAIDVNATSILRSLQLPSHLEPASQILMTYAVQPPIADAPRAVVLARQTEADTPRDWSELPTLDPFATDNPADNAQLLADMLSLKSGFMRTSYRGDDVFCIYRVLSETDPSYLVFLVSAAAVVAPAMSAADYALKSTRRQIDALVPLVIGLIGAVLVIAFMSSRAVTGPVGRLARAAREVARGDFTVHVDVRTGDELEHLADTFNEMIPQLEKHAQVREALALAREVQQHLLPERAPKLKGVDVAGAVLYCDQTGGDYYDFIDLQKPDNATVGIAVGDVSGHGIPSALLMTTVRALLHGSADRLISPPRVLQHINQHLVGDINAGRFMTLFYLLVDAANQTLTWASAGHDPAIRYDVRTQMFSELSGQDIPLGIDRDWQYGTAQSSEWGDEEIILMGTDGIWESRSPTGDSFGKQRLCEIVRRHASASAERLCQHVVDELAAFRQSETQRDDVTVVVLRLVREASAATA